MKKNFHNYVLKRQIYLSTLAFFTILFFTYFFIFNSLAIKHENTQAKQIQSFKVILEEVQNLAKFPSANKVERIANSLQTLKKHPLKNDKLKEIIQNIENLQAIAIYENSLTPSLFDQVERNDIQKIYRNTMGKIQSDLKVFTQTSLAKEQIEIAKQIKQRKFEQLTLVIALAILLAIILFIYKDLHKIFQKPIQALIHGGEQIRAGNLDHLIDVKEASQDDFGQLMRNFNMMARRISTMTSRLEQANLSLQDQSDTFEESAKQKVKFIRQLGHELRAPLSSIIGFAEMLKEGYYGEISDKQKDYLERIHRSGNTLLSMVNDLVDQAKLQTGTWQLNFDRADLYQLVEEIYLETEIIAEKQGIILLFDEKSINKLPAIVDRKLVRQLMVNLIANAIKFSEAGGTITLSLKELTGKKSWRFSVKDEGIGIPKEEIDKIFDEFHQVQSSYSSKGAGLGLPLCLKIAEMHSGKITVDSTPGEGSQFNLIVPINPLEKVTETKTDQPEASQPSPVQISKKEL